ncbi:MAG TPA: DUF2589 domain-containing protein [Bacteroidia bacterium]|jgi:hypothetical protein|nr:DUF2589 domain-containing protein [Bacteroidia bacterium]
MISFKSFITAIHDAIMASNDSMTDKNEALLDKYFEASSVTDPNAKAGTPATKKTLVPKTVTLEYPNLSADGKQITTLVQVPLITMVPLQSSKIEKATLTADFELEIVGDALQLNFADSGSNRSLFRKSKTNRGTLEIVISPQETSEGLKLLIEGYETILKRQIS